MSERTTPGDRRASRGGPTHGASGAAPAAESPPIPSTLEPSARERFDALSQPIRERFEEPITRVSTLTQKTMALFPVRVWRHFLARNGFILSAGMSYQALFAIFAAVYVVFAVAGIWLTGNEEALNAFIALLNSFAPGLIGDDGIISTDDLVAIATTSTSLFGWTGAVALVGLIWTAIGWITYSRIAVRSIFGLPKDTRAYALLKTRDFLVGPRLRHDPHPRDHPHRGDDVVLRLARDAARARRGIRLVEPGACRPGRCSWSSSSTRSRSRCCSGSSRAPRCRGGACGSARSSDRRRSRCCSSSADS